MSKRQRAKSAVAANPVTTVSGLGGILVLLANFLGMSEETIAAVASATIAVALAVRAVVAWWQARNA